MSENKFVDVGADEAFAERARSGAAPSSLKATSASCCRRIPLVSQATNLDQVTKWRMLLGFGIGTLLVLAAFVLPDVRKNTLFVAATCQGYADGVLQPEIRPYRRCTQSCFGCFQSWNPIPCSVKLGMHRSINEYDMAASMYIAGSCAGSLSC